MAYTRIMVIDFRKTQKEKTKEEDKDRTLQKNTHTNRQRYTQDV